MSNDDKMGQIIPFKLGVGAYIRKGRSFFVRNDFVPALKYMRRAYLMDREEPEAQLALAETLNRMQLYEESLRILLLSSSNSASPESLFGIASNYMAMEEFEPAKACLEQYTTIAPDGIFADEAEDYLDLLNDEEELAAQMRLPESDDIKLIEQLHIAKSMHFNLRDKEAEKMLKEIEKSYSKSVSLQTEIALFEINCKKYIQAEQRLFGLLKIDKRNAKVLSLIALIQYTTGREMDAKETLARIILSSDMSTEELIHSASMLIELKQYKRAAEALGYLLRILPYDRLALHQSALCKYMLDDRDGAGEVYQKLLDMDEHDTVADYYLNAVRKRDPFLKKRIMSSYEVPIVEVGRRLKYLRSILSEEDDKLQACWAEDMEFRKMVKWSLFSALSPMRDKLIQFLGYIKDEEAQYLLRDYLLRMDQADSFKTDAIDALHATGFKGTFGVYIAGKWQLSYMESLIIPESMPSSFERILNYIVSAPELIKMPKNTSQIAAKIFFYYYNSLGDNIKPVTSNQIQAMGAAFILMSLHAQQDPMTADELCEIFNISMRRLNNALTKIFTALDKQGEDPECDS